jgi:hypothetical protein
MAATRPSIMSEGLTQSAPARAWNIVCGEEVIANRQVCKLGWLDKVVCVWTGGRGVPTRQAGEWGLRGALLPQRQSSILRRSYPSPCPV